MKSYKKLLKHGYIKVIEKWGSDKRIIESARMSTNKGFLGWGRLTCKCGAYSDIADIVSSNSEGGVLFKDKNNTRCSRERGGAHVSYDKPGDEKLLKYLSDNWHETPFEFAGLIVEVQAPIFVFREWHRHRTQSFNEMSARYTPIPDLTYIPSLERLLINSQGNNKQAGTIKNSDILDEKQAKAFIKNLKNEYKNDEDFYQWSLKIGVPKELARIALPVGRMSRMRASANLRNWLHFLTLRMDKKAQWEIRQYANALAEFIQDRFPRTYEIYLNKNHV